MTNFPSQGYFPINELLSEVKEIKNIGVHFKSKVLHYTHQLYIQKKKIMEFLPFCFVPVEKSKTKLCQKFIYGIY